VDDFLGALIGRIDASGQNFARDAFEVLSHDIQPLLNVVFVTFVVFYGAQLMTGTARIGISDIIGRIVRAFVILVLVGSWANFAVLFHDWITVVPEAAGRSILAASATGVEEPTNGLSQIWKTANVASAAFSEQAGYLSVLPALVGIIIMIFAGIFVAIALGILVLAKVALWVLLATAPIFIACAFFKATRNYAIGWLNQTLLYGLIPLFVYVISAFLIAAMEPELTKIDRMSGERELTLSDFAGFIMLCIAGSFILFQVQSLAQGIVGTFATALGEASRRLTGSAISFTRDAIAPPAGRRAVPGRFGGGHDGPFSPAGEAMQRTIILSGTPR
jgi:type IV secretion system protein VirB6